MTRFKAGVIGVGHLGQHHARLYASLPGAQLVGVADESVERAQTIAARHGAGAFRTVDELLSHVDVVSVAIPTSRHYAVVKACLLAGHHVLAGKPNAVPPGDAHHMARMGGT